MKGSSSPGGLTVGILSAMRSSGGLWFGWNGETVPGEQGGAEITMREGITYATFPLPQHLYDRHYSGFANGTLWPLFHYFLAGFRYEDHEYAAFREANLMFARRLVEHLRPSDRIWVHDYQLIPLGEELRTLGVKQRIGFFLHVPFPHFEVLRALPRFAEIVRALLAYDLVGFQTETDRASFLDAVRQIHGANAVRCERWASASPSNVQTGVFPIGVDVKTIGQSAARSAATGTVQRTVQSLLGRRLIIGADRLDPSKGLLERFRAYQHFLEDYPDQRGQVTYLQIAPLGRQSVRAYSQIRDALEQSSGRTNGRFADADWTPVRYLNRNYPHATLMGFLRAAQVCLVTPLRDGMNLVAKEFVAAQNPADPGVLVLSNMAGAARELTDALLVNPYDTKGIARAIHSALVMPLAERRARHERMLAVLQENDIHRWHRRFLEQLTRESPTSSDEPSVASESV
jgi:trehalose 6-phosphate synthase